MIITSWGTIFKGNILDDSLKTDPQKTIDQLLKLKMRYKI